MEGVYKVSLSKQLRANKVFSTLVGDAAMHPWLGPWTVDAAVFSTVRSRKVLSTWDGTPLFRRVASNTINYYYKTGSWLASLLASEVSTRKYPVSI